MNWCIKVICLVVYIQIVTTKSIDKTYPKKVTALTLKPTKTPKSVVEELSSLPPDDLEFIKELDTQFKLHGDKIKIKVERYNSTIKNLKRTIDGSLGYGYQHTNIPKYQFSRPRFMLYPYSQNDIPAGQAQHIISQSHRQHYVPGSIQIQPSQAFEIKETRGGYQTFTPHNQHYVPQYSQPTYLPVNQYVEPVIVLRIPGPTKYAAHLQALLQRYLEVRAAQYLKILQEQEANGQNSAAGQSYGPPPQYQHDHSVGSNNDGSDSDSHNFQPINQVYQSVHYSNNDIPQHHYQSQVNYESNEESNENQESEHNDEQSYSYDTETQTETSSYHHHHHDNSYHYRTPIYVGHGGHGGHSSVYDTSSQNKYDSEDSHLPTNENYPSHTHTKVHFVQDSKNDDHSIDYPLATITTPRYHQHLAASVTTPQYEQPSSSAMPRYHYEQNHSQQEEEDANEEEEEDVVSITQKPRVPYNYHAHPVLSSSGSSLHEQSQRNVPYSEEQFHKLNQLLSQLKTKNFAAPTGHLQ